MFYIVLMYLAIVTQQLSTVAPVAFSLLFICFYPLLVPECLLAPRNMAETHANGTFMTLFNSTVHHCHLINHSQRGSTQTYF